MKVGKVDVLKLLYAVSVVLPLLENAVKHLVGFVVDTVKEIREKWAEAMGG